MKRKKKSLFAILLALVMMAGLMQGMTVETKAATNSVQVGPFTLSRDSGTIVEGVDYTYGKYGVGNRNSLTILTDDITIAMDENAEPTSDIIELGELNTPPLDSFSKVTFSNLKLKSYSYNVLSYVDNIHITLVGNNELVSIKKESDTYGDFAIFGCGSVSIENSPNGSHYATADGLGWGAIMYLAAIAGIDQEMYDAAKVDGAGRFQKMWHVTVPGLIPTYCVMLLMSIANILSNGMDQYMVFDNPNNTNVNMVLDYYVYKLGIMDGNIPFATMVGMVKSVVSVVLLFAANGVSKLLRGESIV